MRVLVLGDVHGCTQFVCDYVFPTAKALGVDAILQLGDYGYWEHEDEGLDYNDAVSEVAMQTDIPFHFLRGNHDNWAHLIEHYQTSDDRGFVKIRDNLWFIPDGTVWTWGSQSFRVFGGAYSVDKAWRLDLEQKRNKREWHRRIGRAADGLPEEPMRNHTGSIWFPDEEMDTADFERYLAEYSGPVDIVVSHDRPRSVDVQRELKDVPECWRTQDMLQRALTTHQPKLWLHGHYHHRYASSVRCGDDDRHTTVMGLACDWNAAPRFVRPHDAWLILDLDQDGIPLQVIAGNHPMWDAKLDPEAGDDAA